MSRCLLDTNLQYCAKLMRNDCTCRKFVLMPIYLSSQAGHQSLSICHDAWKALASKLFTENKAENEMTAYAAFWNKFTGNPRHSIISGNYDRLRGIKAFCSELNMWSAGLCMMSSQKLWHVNIKTRIIAWSRERVCIWYTVWIHKNICTWREVWDLKNEIEEYSMNSSRSKDLHMRNI